jgi:hypothetical protein
MNNNNSNLNIINEEDTMQFKAIEVSLLSFAID